jgi:hypothetical protein
MGLLYLYLYLAGDHTVQMIRALLSLAMDNFQEVRWKISRKHTSEMSMKASLSSFLVINVAEKTQSQEQRPTDGLAAGYTLREATQARAMH